MMINPISLLYKPFIHGFGDLDTTKLSIKGITKSDAERTYIVVRHSDTHKTAFIWVDPRHECRPIKYVEERKGIPIRAVEMAYREGEQGEWVLESWKDDYTSPIGYYSARFRVVSIAINEPAEDALVDVDEVPVNTYVRDMVHGRKYIKRKDDERPVLPGEWRATHFKSNFKELVDSDPPTKSRFPVLTMIASSIAVWYVVHLLRKRHRARGA